MALKGFKSISVLGCGRASTMTITNKYFKFNGDTAKELDYPTHIVFQINDKTKQVAIVARNAEDDKAVEFPCKREGERQYAINIAQRAAHVAIRKMMSWDERSRKMQGVYVPEENAIIYNLEQATIIQKDDND